MHEAISAAVAAGLSHTAPLLTQVQLEDEMYAHGRARTARMMARNEEGGRANNNPYAQAIYRRYVLPLAEIVREDVAVKKAGRRKAHTILLGPVDPEAVAFLAVRNTLNTLMGNATAPKEAGFNLGGDDHGSFASVGARTTCTAVGKAIYHELLLSLFEHAAPDLFYTLVNDLGRRMSKSERHRMTVFKLQAKEAGIEFPEWGKGGVDQVGAYLIDQLEKLGMCETAYMIEKPRNGRRENLRTKIGMKLTSETLDLIGQIKEHVSETTPYYLPCVEQPRDWVAVNDGGFHTTAMRRMQPFAVRSHGSWSRFAEADMSTPLAAINALQRVPWAINGRMLDTIRNVARHFDMDEVLSQAEYPAPPRPDWLFGDMKFEGMSPLQQEEFIHWKRQKAEWFTQAKLRGTKYGRFYTATSVADKFCSYPAIYFVYFADFRGRLYAQTTGVSPQGSDMQKALLQFAVGKPLDSLDAERWFCIHGANKWGYDKASLDDRVRWVADRKEHILAFADDPISNNEWRDADSPLQFLAWCFEYAAWVKSPHTFLSHLPVGMDGSCNGLQNFSAMLRDEVGGKATNLLPAALPNDIYQMVADVTALRLRQTDPDDKGYRDRWLSHGINRTLVKRSVMTLPYGSTRFSCADFIVGDYLKLGKVVEFAKEEYGPAAQYLSHFVWDAIAEVVVKAREAMAWLQGAARRVIGEGGDEITWTTPSGFPVFQQYVEQEEHRINTKLCGNAKLRMQIDTETPDRARHRNGIAPNFIHSYDASHLALVTAAAAGEGLHLAMIHDDYGTHASDAARLYRIIREVFVGMYEGCDPLAEFAARYELPAPPALGTLNLRAVLESPYFFS